MKSELIIYTSFVSPLSLPEFIEKGLLPIFIIRSIGNSNLIKSYEGSPVHMKDLSPSSELFRKKRDKLITIDEFKKLYAIEISNVSLERVIKDLEMLVEISGASGVVLLGYGSNKDICHRGVLSNILNESGLLVNRIKEIIV